MARSKDKRRVSKDHLALAVRKDFNAAGVSEQEVITTFLYSVHNQSKCDQAIGTEGYTDSLKISISECGSHRRGRHRMTRTHVLPIRAVSSMLARIYMQIQYGE